MKSEELLRQTQALRQRIQPYGRDGEGPTREVGAKAQVCQFLRTHAGPQSSFAKEAEAINGYASYQVTNLTAILDSFIEYQQSGLHTAMSPERQAQIGVVSDFLDQASQLLQSDDYHPAVAAFLIGASLEEFLRNWAEAEDLSIGEAKPGLDAYAKTLRASELLSKQDIKDITAWAGIRNDAAHGKWDQVSDRNRIRLMLEGVNLFMRQKSE